MEMSLMVGEKEIELSTNHYPGALHPQGYEKLSSFEVSPTPTWTYEAEGITIQHSLALVHGKNQLLLKYECLDAPSQSVHLKLKPFLAYRVNHELTQKNEFISGDITESSKGFSLCPYDGMPALYFSGSQKLHTENYDDWFLNLEFYRERERGFDHHEDLYCPCTIELELKKGQKDFIAVSTDGHVTAQENIWNLELKRREELDKATTDLPMEEWKVLHRQGEQFLTRNARNELSITAGFPWFVEWGRDTMIALPGLTIHRGRPDLGLEILTSYAKHEKDGLIPNYLAIGDGQHAYNSIDASLWFFWAIGEMLNVKGYKKKVTDALLPTMENIIRAYMEDKVPQAHINENGLIYAGNPGTQLTWMDANAYGRPATSRHGCPVEINALFLHAIHLYKHCGGSASKLPGLNELESKLKTSFVEKFWNDEKGYLADVVRNEPDFSIRPNQLFAVSLSSCPLSKAQKRSVVEVARRDLLTPYGMRTLSADHPQFRARYEGNGDERDSGYHQGTVWPWLLGHFIEASILTADDPAYEAQRLKDDLEPLYKGHLWEFGLGSIAEVYDATPPHFPAGTIAQAWSVSEMLRGFNIIHKALK
jgi:predicted glycogen debranching enzyme